VYGKLSAESVLFESGIKQFSSSRPCGRQTINNECLYEARRIVMFWIKILLPPLVIPILLFPFVAYALSWFNLFYTKVETGNGKYIYVGDTWVKTIADVKDHVLVKNKLEKGEQKKSWLNKHLGIYYIGFPPKTVRTFEIDRRKEEEATTGKPSTQWIKNLGKKRVDSLRAVFPRPFFLENIELGSGIQVNLLVVGKFFVYDFSIPVPELKGDFFGNTSSTLKGGIGDKIKDIPDENAFLKANKGEGGILESLTKTEGEETFNRKYLAKQVGLFVMGLAIADWEYSDPALREAWNKKAIEEKNRDAILVKADAYEKDLKIRTDADVDRQIRLATAAGTRVKAIRENLSAAGVDPNTIAKETAKILRAEAQPNVTTLVEEGGASVTVPVGSKR
jgi:hypothetical protein